MLGGIVKKGANSDRNVDYERFFAACSTWKIVRTMNGMVSRLGQAERGNPILNARTLADR